MELTAQGFALKWPLPVSSEHSVRGPPQNPRAPFENPLTMLWALIHSAQCGMIADMPLPRSAFSRR